MPRTNLAPTGTTIDLALTPRAWNPGGPIYFQFPTSQEAYRNGSTFTSPDAIPGFSPATPDQIAAFRAAFAQLDQMLGVSFIEVPPGETPPSWEVIRVGNTSSGVSNSRAQYPGTTALGSDLWIGIIGGGEPTPGSFSLYTVIHEMAHALGLKHPFDTVGAFAGSQTLDPGLVQSIASYQFKFFNSDGSVSGAAGPTDLNHPQSFQPLDIRALQHLYGKNPDSDGDDLYTLLVSADGASVRLKSDDGDPKLFDVDYGGASKLFVSLWDSGGADHLSFAGVLRAAPGGAGVSVTASGDLLNVSYEPADPRYSNGFQAPMRVAPAIRFLLDDQSRIERFTGSAFKDEFAGFLHAVQIAGGGGDDRIGGSPLGDLLEGGAGNDFIDGGQGLDRLYGDAGDDHLVGGAARDDLYGGDGDDLIGGQDGDDFVDGGSGRDTLFGDAGGDHIVGGGDQDGLYGQDGDDLIGGQDSDDYIDGGSGRDTLFGDAGGDHMVGGGDGDRLHGQDGDDLIGGQDGDDYIDGGFGRDTLFGDAGGDHIVGGADGDRLNGQDGDDLIGGQDGDDFIDGGSGRDMLFGDVGDDHMIGGGDGDRLHGQDGDDLIGGQDGDDYIEGGSGRDTLFGDAGADVIFGGAGGDVLFGQGGADVFLFASLDDSRSDASDRISDLGAGDLIDLSAIDADAQAAGDQAFRLVEVFSRQAGQAVLSFDGVRSILTLDGDGDGVADFRLEIEGRAEPGSLML